MNLSKTIISLYGTALFLAPICFAGQTPQKVPILLYHHLQDLPPTASPLLRRWTVSPENLDSQVAWLSQHGFHTISMVQLLNHLKRHQPLPVKPIVLTFDDGWRDHYSVAFGILKKYQSTATFFIITDSVGHSAYMKWGQIKEMADAGMDMEAHTVTHPKLTKIPSQEAFNEILQSKQDLEEHLHRPVTVFAYPYGAFSDKIIGMVKRAGFDGAAAVGGMNVGYIYRADQTYTLYRKVVMNYESLDEFWRQY